jgi:hypothetical protein
MPPEFVSGYASDRSHLSLGEEDGHRRGDLSRWWNEIVSIITPGLPRSWAYGEGTAITVVINSMEALPARSHLSLGRWCCRPMTAAAGGRPQAGLEGSRGSCNDPGPVAVLALKVEGPLPIAA